MHDLLTGIASIVRSDIESWAGHDLYDEIVEDRAICLHQGLIGTPNGYDVATDTAPDDERYEAWQAERTLTHNERIALALLPKDPCDPEWDGRSERAADFLRRNGNGR